MSGTAPVDRGSGGWSIDDPYVTATLISVAAPVHSPPTMSRPHPPIMIGGTGERRTLPLVARYADMCNVFDIPDGGATVRHKLGHTGRVLTAIGRPFEEMEKTISTRLYRGETPASFVERCQGFAELGIDHVAVVTTPGRGPTRPSPPSPPPSPTSPTAEPPRRHHERVTSRART